MGKSRGWCLHIHLRAKVAKERTRPALCKAVYFGVLLTSTVLLPGTASAAGTPGPATSQTNTLAISPPAAAPGATVNISGSGFVPNTEVQVLFDLNPAGKGPADAQGAFTFKTTVPAGAPFGEHTIAAAGRNTTGPWVLRATVLVAEQSSATVSQAQLQSGATLLPRTDSEATGIALLAAAFAFANALGAFGLARKQPSPYLPKHSAK